METPPSRKPPHARWVAITLVSLLLAGLVLAWFAARMPLPGGSPAASFQAGAIEANNTLSSTSNIVSSSAQGWFAAKRIAVMAGADHPVVRGVANRLAKRLKLLPFVEQVDVYPAGEWPAVGSPLHDICVRVTLPEFKAAGFPATGRTVDASLVVTAGRDLWNSRHGYVDSLSPPANEAWAEFDLSHHSVFRGYETAGAKYQQVIENMAGQVGNALAKMLQDLTAKYGVAAAVPAGLYPAYRPIPPELPLPTSKDLKLRISGPGLMLHNYAVWTLDAPDPQGALADAHSRLLAAKWQVHPKELKRDSAPGHFRGSRDGRVIEVFEERASPAGEAEAGTGRLVFRYSDRMTREELRPVFESMLAAGEATAKDWLRFGNCMPTDVSHRMLESLLGKGGKLWPADMEIALVRHLHGSGRVAEAQARLPAASVAALLDGQDRTGEIRKLGAEISGHEDWVPPAPTAQELQKLGFRAVAPGGKADMEVALNQAAVFYQQTAGESAGLALVAAVVEPSTIPEGVYTLSLRCISAAGHGRSNCGSTPHHPAKPWRCSAGIGQDSASWRVDASEIAQERFHIELASAPPES